MPSPVSDPAGADHSFLGPMRREAIAHQLQLLHGRWHPSAGRASALRTALGALTGPHGSAYEPVAAGARQVKHTACVFCRPWCTRQAAGQLMRYTVESGKGPSRENLGGNAKIIA
jgi:hypothetical protein